MYFAILLGIAQAANDCSNTPSPILDLDHVLSKVAEVPSEPTGTSAESTPPLWQSFPYFYQYSNAAYKSSSCQNTSVAMVLRHYGVDVTPDHINSRFGKNKTQSPEGLARVFNTYAAEAGIKQRITAHREGTMADVDALLSAGKPVIVHGYFTGSGHVVVALGETKEGYVVNDPSGRWNQSWKGGYSGKTATNGRAVVYDSASFRQAVATSDGQNHLPVWYHEISP